MVAGPRPPRPPAAPRPACPELAARPVAPRVAAEVSPETPPRPVGAAAASAGASDLHATVVMRQTRAIRTRPIISFLRIAARQNGRDRDWLAERAGEIRCSQI